jgi:hypothetical protein
MPELRCGNCGYWSVAPEIRGKLQVGICLKINGPEYLNRPTCRDACPEWGAEGGKGPEPEMVHPPSRPGPVRLLIPC